MEVKEAWDTYDIATADDNKRIIDALVRITAYYNHMIDIPDNLDGLSYTKANAIERIIHEVYGLSMMATPFYVGDGFVSTFPLDEQVFDDNWDFHIIGG
jgi:hypothetical protein